MAESIVIQLNTVAAGTGIQATVAGLNRVKSGVEGLHTKMLGMARTFAAGIVPTVTLAGLVRFGQQIVNNADQLAKSAQKAGESSAEFSRLASIGELAGVSIEKLTEAAKKLPEWLEKTGQTGKTLTQVLVEQADVFAKMPDNLSKVALANQIFGESGQHLLPLLNQGSAALREQIEEAERFGIVIGPRFARNAQAFNDNLTRIKNVFVGMGNIVADATLPAIIKFQEAFIEWVKDGDKHLKFVDYLTGEFKKLALGVLGAGLAFDVFLVNFAALRKLGSGGFKEAFSTALEEGGKALERFRARFDSIMDIGRKPDNEPGGRNDNKPPKTVDALRNNEILLAQSSIRIAEIEANLTLSSREKNKELAEVYNERAKIVNDMLDQLNATIGSTLSTAEDGTVRFTEKYSEKLSQINTLLKEQIDLRQKLTIEPDPEGFIEKLSDGIDRLISKFDDLGGSIADVLVDGLQNAIDTVADGIWQVIDGTATWGQLFQQVARNIISDLIKIMVQEIALDALKRGITSAWNAFSKSMRASDTADQNANEAAKAPGLWANATAAAISSYGIAAAIGIAAIAAALASAGAFAEGGIVAGGEQLIRVNERGTEAVLNARATSMLGAETINALNAGEAAALSARMEGKMIASDGGSGLDSARPVQINVAIFDSRDTQRMKEWAMSAEGNAVFIDIARQNRSEIGIRS